MFQDLAFQKINDSLSKIDEIVADVFVVISFFGIFALTDGNDISDVIDANL